MSDLLERTLGLAPDTRERLLWTIGVVFSAPTTNHTADFGRDSGVAITARMPIPLRDRRGIDNAFGRCVLSGIAADPGVGLAYPTVRAFLPDAVRVQGGDGV